ncbi:alginate export family protein [Catenovulum sediminis]|uniref:Alginate export family protein n=1 Tax=Catenovulum sediminis TaxID=1740262 RepID=A0ABV1RDD6_9ALTE
MELKKSKLALTLASLIGTGLISSPAMAADSLAEAFKEGKATGDLRLRYESVDDASSANALTFRTRLGFKTADLNGFTGFVEFEDNRVVAGVDEYKVPPAGKTEPSDKSVIPDPEFTELEQAYIAYKSGGFSAKLGRQVLTLDGHRHVGHVGWRQDRQTFDALNVVYGVGDFTANVSYVYKHNRIFAEATDIDSSDILVNLSYKTPVGKVVVYGYQIDTDPAGREDLDTYGVSFAGSTGSDVKFLYSAEYATQDNNKGNDTDYLSLELGAVFSGVTVKLGQETLGSDDGLANFATPLATLHKFNGFADVFLGGTFASGGLPNGLVDTYGFVGTKVGGIALKAFYHTFKSDFGSIDYGDEIDLVAATKVGDYGVGLKYASFSADMGTDKDILWAWVETKF